MSANKWVHRDRECIHCNSSHVIHRGTGVRTFKDWVAEKLVLRSISVTRLSCKSCGKNWTPKPEDESPYGKVSITLATLVRDSCKVEGGMAEVIRNTGLNAGQVARIRDSSGTITP